MWDGSIRFFKNPYNNQKKHKNIKEDLSLEAYRVQTIHAQQN